MVSFRDHARSDGQARDARDGAQPQRAPLVKRCLRRVLAGRAGARRARWGAAPASPVYEDARFAQPASLAGAAGGKEREGGGGVTQSEL